MSDLGTPWGFAGESPAVATAPTVTLVRGTSFVICQRTGDIGGGPVDGAFVGDVRICSLLRLFVDGESVDSLTSVATQPHEGLFVGRIAPPAPGQAGVLVTRCHRVGRGVATTVTLRNLGHLPRTLFVQFELAADLANLFAVKEGRADIPPAPIDAVPDGFCFGDRRAGAVARVEPVAELDTLVRSDGAHGLLTWTAPLAPAGSDGDEWTGSVELSAVRHGVEVPLEAPVAVDVASTVTWGPVPTVKSDIEGFDDAFSRAVDDLAGLRIVDPDHPQEAVIAAGAPWFMTLFGRDSILTSWMALVLDPTIGVATATALARLQGTRVVAETDEEPGKILHEVRPGAGGSSAFADGDIYYGSADATPLFVCLVAELRRWGVDLDILQPLLPAVDRALDWVAHFGDRDGDGYVEYQRATVGGLANQGWKDSWDGISFADGALATGPVALAEVQGYVYAAWSAGAELAACDGRDDVAVERRARAAALRDAFNRDFWDADRGVVVLALDGDKRRVDALASNAGHCLWAGILDAEPATATARTLIDPQLASGWGVRTLATSMGRYDPLSYHNGSVWPHDTAICVAGLRRAGFVNEATELTAALLGAARLSDGRLPELFAGLGRDEVPAPVPYPASCSPQAWASAAPLLLLRSMLGLEPDVPNGVVELDPVLPHDATRLAIRGVPLAGTRVDVSVLDGELDVRDLPDGITVVPRR